MVNICFSMLAGWNLLILGPRPANSPRIPASLPSVINLETMGPFGP